MAWSDADHLSDIDGSRWPLVFEHAPSVTRTAQINGVVVERMGVFCLLSDAQVALAASKSPDRQEKLCVHHYGDIAHDAYVFLLDKFDRATTALKLGCNIYGVRDTCQLLHIVCERHGVRFPTSPPWPPPLVVEVLVAATSEKPEELLVAQTVVRGLNRVPIDASRSLGGQSLFQLPILNAKAAARTPPWVTFLDPGVEGEVLCPPPWPPPALAPNLFDGMSGGNICFFFTEYNDSFLKHAMKVGDWYRTKDLVIMWTGWIVQKMNQALVLCQEVHRGASSSDIEAFVVPEVASMLRDRPRMKDSAFDGSILFSSDVGAFGCVLMTLLTRDKQLLTLGWSTDGLYDEWEKHLVIRLYASLVSTKLKLLGIADLSAAEKAFQCSLFEKLSYMLIESYGVQSDDNGNIVCSGFNDPRAGGVFRSSTLLVHYDCVTRLSFVSCLVLASGLLYSESYGTIRSWWPSDHTTLFVLEDDRPGNIAPVLSVSTEANSAVELFENDNSKLVSGYNTKEVHTILTENDKNHLVSTYSNSATKAGIEMLVLASGSNSVRTR